jgi:hypothetical protein
LIVSARSGFNLESTGLVTGKKTILSAIPLPSLSMGIGGGRRCDCDLGWEETIELKVSSTIVVQALRPPEEGWRRYQRPEPRTRREEGEDVGRPRYSIVLVVLRKGSLYEPRRRNEINRPSAFRLFISLTISLWPSAGLTTKS